MSNTLEKQIEKISDYFIGMKKENTNINGVSQSITRIEVDFQPKFENQPWNVFGYPNNVSEREQKIKCVKRKSNDYVYFVFGLSQEVTFLDLIKHVEDIVKVNKIIEDKTELLKSKSSELIKLFSELEYDELKTLTFKYKPKRKKKTDIVLKEEVKEETIIIKPEEIKSDENF